MSSSFALNQSLGFHLNRLAGAMRADFAKRLDRHGFKVSEWALLAAVRQGASTPGAVARMMALDPAAVTRTVDRLVRLNFVTREPSEVDARSQLLKLTTKGKTAVAQLEKEAEATNKLFTCGVSQAEVAHVVGVLNRMFENRLLGD